MECLHLKQIFQFGSSWHKRFLVRCRARSFSRLRDIFFTYHLFTPRLSLNLIVCETYAYIHSDSSVRVLRLPYVKSRYTIVILTLCSASPHDAETQLLVLAELLAYYVQTCQHSKDNERVNV